MFVFYAFPIFLTAWFFSRAAGLLMAALGALSWCLANLTIHPFHSWWGYPLATFGRLTYFVILAVGSAALRARQEADRGRIEALERVTRLEREIIGVSEREQRRIGQDLHDGLCQNLAAIGCAAKSLADDLGEKAQPTAREAQDIEAMLKSAILQARDLARGIHPVHLDETGLSVALESLAITLSRLTGVTVLFQAAAEVPVNDPEVAINLYRITQESLNNAVKHSRATQITITLSREGDQAVLCIADNGIGLLQDVAQRAGMGLKTMEYRARQLGGRLELKPRLGGGTIVKCAVPFAAPVADSIHLILRPT